MQGIRGRIRILTPAAAACAVLLLLLTAGVGAAEPVEGHITGTVYSGTGAPLAGINVVPCTGQPDQAWWEQHWDLSVSTQADGSYDLLVPAGTYRVRFDDPSGTYGYQFWPGVTTAGGGWDIVVNPGGTFSGADVNLPIGAKITGKVTRDSDGAALENIGVVAAAEWNGQWPGQVGARTTSAGTYELRGLPPGQFMVSFSDDFDDGSPWEYAGELYNGQPPYRPDLGQKFILNEGYVIGAIDASLADAASIEGQVTGLSSALDGARVWLAADMGGNWGWMQMVTTGLDGTYSFQGLQSGTYRIQFDHPSGNWATECYDNKPPFVQTSADNVDLDIGEHLTGVNADLAPAGHIAGTVTDPGGGPVGGVQVTANVNTGGYLESVAWAQTESDGTYDLGGLQGGSYVVQFSAGSDWLSEFYDNVSNPMGATPVGVTPGATTYGIDAVLDLGSHIAGTVTDGAGPLEGVQAVPLRWAGYWETLWWTGSSTDSSGHYDIGPLEPGTYRLGFYSGGDYATEFWENKSASFWADDIDLGEGVTFTADAVLAPAAHIKGRVTSDGVTGLAGISVGAGPYDPAGGEWLYEHIVWAETDADGYYDLGGLPAGAFRVQFWDNSGDWIGETYDDAPGFFGGTDVVLGTGDTQEGIDAVLAPASHIVGTVTDGTDPLQNISVNLYTFNDWGDGSGWWEQVPWAQWWTRADGSYDIGGLEPGTYRVGFRDDSGTYASEFWDDQNAANWADDIELGAAASFTADAILVSAGHITGRVTSDGETGIPNIGVGVGPYDEDLDIYEHIAWGQTDADGNYDVGGLPAGTFHVSFWDDSGNYLSEDYNDVRDWHEAADVTLGVGATVSGIDAVLASASHISGTVTDGASPLENIRVSLYWFEDWGDGEGWWQENDWSVWTNSEGYYDIGGLDPGTYRLGFRDDSRAYATEFWNDKNGANFADDINLGESETFPADAVLAPGGHITGRVTSDGDTGIPNITVAAGPYNLQSDIYEHIARTQTDEEGYYDLSGLPAGTFHVSFWDDNGMYLSEEYDDVRDWHEAADVTLGVSETVSGIDAVLAQASRIVGTVTDGAEPLQNIRVAVYFWEDWGDGTGWWGDWGYETWTDENGYYELGGLEPGTYRLGFRDDSGTYAAEFWDDKNAANLAADDIVLGESETFPADAELAVGGRITGRVTDDGGAGIPNVTVAAGPYDLDADIYEHIAWTQTDAEGNYDLGGLPAGTFHVSFWDDNGNYLGEDYDDVRDWHEATDVTLGVGETVSGIDAVLASASRIAGTVTDGTSPLENIRVSLFWFEDWGDGSGWWQENDWSVWTDAEGHYDIGGLDPGTYRLGFRDDSRAYATEFWNDKNAANLADDIVLGESETFPADAVIAPGGHITGRVTSDGDTGIPNITVAAGPYNLQSDIYEHIAWTQTDEEGYYDLAGLPAGTFHVSFWDDNGMYLGEDYDDVRDWHEATDVTLGVGETVSGIDAVLAQASRVVGTVTDGVDPLQNIRVAVYFWEDWGDGTGWWNDWGYETWTDENGSYDLGGLEPGTYRLGFQDVSGTFAIEFWDDKNAANLADDIVLGESDTFTADAVLAPGGHIKGRVTSDGTTGIANITVAAGPYDLDSGIYEQIAGTQTDENGYYDLNGLPAGTFRVQFWDDWGNWLSETYDDVGDWPDGTDVVLGIGETVSGIDAVLAESSHIVGTVTDGIGPVSGIRVSSYYFIAEDEFGNGWWEEMWWIGTSTDENGYYDLGFLEAGTYRVGFHDDQDELVDYATEFWDDKNAVSVADDIVLGDASTFEANAVLAAAGHITGRVTSDGVNGIANITVAAGAFDVDMGYCEHIVWAQTDENGDYDLAGLPAGTFRVQFWDDSGNWLGEFYDDVINEWDATDVSVAAGGTQPGIDAVLTPAAHINGTVTEEGSGLPIEGIRVYPGWFDGETGSMLYGQSMYAETGQDGTYSLDGLEPGTYRLRFGDPTSLYATEFWNDKHASYIADDIVVGVGDIATADAELAGSAHITGRATSDGDTGIGGITVAAGPYDADTGGYEHIAWTQTDENGNYDLAGLPQDTYRVQFMDDSGMWLGEYYNDATQLADADDVVLAAGATESGIDAVLTIASHITGTVTDEASGDPLEFIRVYAYWFDGANWSICSGASTYADGTYDLGGLPEGQYKVEFGDREGPLATEYWDNKFDVDSGDWVDVGFDSTTPGIDAALSMSPPNRPPVLGAIGNKSVNELSLLSFTATAVDPDFDLLEFSLGAGAPSDASITAGGAFTWAPTEAQGPGSYPVTVIVTDSQGATDSETITVTVAKVNDAPVLTPIGAKSIDELSLLSFTASATDADVPADTLTFSLGAGAPAGAAITSSGAFTWTPSEAQGPGSYPITVIVSDGTATDSETVTVTVAEVAEPNRPPVLTPIGAKSVNEGSLLAFTASATDPDIPADPLTFSLGAGAPAGASITAGGAFSWTPTEAQGPGSYPVTVIVSDGEATDSETFTVTVAKVNDAPEIATISDKWENEGSTLIFTAMATDADIPADTLSYSLGAGAPVGANITSGGSFTWTPSEAQGPGVYPITVVVSDGTLTDSDTFTVTVAEVRRAPVLAPISDKSVNEGSLLAFTALATDEDLPADTLSFSLGAGAPAGAAITSGGSFTWTPSEAQGPGSYPVTVIVSDGTDTDSDTFTVTVAEVTEEVTYTPIAGTTRITTAIEIAKKAYPGGAANVVIATAMNWPDALGASALAGALEGPILLTTQSSLPEAVADEIESLEATHVVIVGGEPAVSKYVMQQIDALEGVSVERIGGANRYETANLVAQKAVDVLGEDYDGTAFVATGMNFPDALGASPLAARQGWPIYLTNPAWGANPTVIDAMEDADVARAVVLGGTNVVSTTIEGALETAFGPDTERLSGANRYETAIEVATWGVANAELHWDKLALATGQNFPDALAGGVLQGKDSSVMLLTPSTSLYAGVEDVLVENKGTITEVRFLGGLPALSQTVRDQVEDALD